jgi:hypothetical protein
MPVVGSFYATNRNMINSMQEDGKIGQDSPSSTLADMKLDNTESGWEPHLGAAEAGEAEGRYNPPSITS